MRLLGSESRPFAAGTLAGFHGELSDHALEKRPVPTIFHEPWWLETASGGAYREATISSDGIVVGWLPYLLSKKASGQKVLTPPTITHVLGPALSAEIVANDSVRSLKQFAITRDLIAQLPGASHVWFPLHHGVSNTVAFEAAGFSCNVSFTTEIAPDSNEALWRRMRDKTRNVIRRAQERLTVIDRLDPEEFLDFYEDNLHERGLRNNYNRHICGRLIAESIRRNFGRLLIATDSSGNFQSGIFTVWDHEMEYYLLSTRALKSMNGATSLLIWTAIQHAALKGLTFDTANVGKENLLLLTGFGGTLRPRYVVWKTSLLYYAVQFADRLLTARSS